MNCKKIQFNFFIIITLICVSLNAQTDSTILYQPEGQQAEFICPMFCSVYVSSVPGRCPVCGMNLIPKEEIENPKEYKIIKPVELKDLLDNNEKFLLLDVRTESEYNGSLKPLNGAISIPVKELEERIGELDEYKDLKIIVYCSFGIRSAKAAKFLSEKGFDAYSLLGGLLRWNGD